MTNFMNFINTNPYVGLVVLLVAIIMVTATVRMYGKKIKKGLIVVLLCMLASSTYCQSYVVDSTGAIVEVKKQVKKSNDPVYDVKDGITFYRGKKGGIYYFYQDKATGIMKKRYIKKK
jgi:hypothetical protein